MTSSTSTTNLPKLSGEKNSDGNFILPISDGKQVIRIQRLGRMGGECMWFDFEQVPQGYIHICGTGISKPKRSRKFKHVNNVLVDPTDDQIIEQGKNILARNLNPDDFIWIVDNKDYEKKLEKRLAKASEKSTQSHAQILAENS